MDFYYLHKVNNKNPLIFVFVKFINSFVIMKLYIPTDLNGYNPTTNSTFSATIAPCTAVD